MDKFVIIDGNNLMYRAFYALPQLANFDGEISNAVFGFANMIVKCIKEVSPKYIAVTFDIAKKNFRHERFPEYKGTRKPTPEELKSQFPIVKEMLRRMGICVVEKDGLEADDLMGILSRKFDTENVIVSGDRDTFQLINNNTSVMFPKKGLSETIELNTKNLKDYYGVEPNQVVDLKSLMGDASDNIPGVAGIGEKTALDLINKYNTLQGVYDHIDDIKGKLQEKLINGKDNAFLSQYLAEIVTKYDLDYKLSDFEYVFPFGSDVVELFKRYQFNSLLRHDELFGDVQNIEESHCEKILVGDNEALDSMLDQVLHSSEISLYLDDGSLHIYDGREYVVNFVQDLLTVGLDYNSVIQECKSVFENGDIHKVVFNTKSLKHTLHNLGIELHGVSFDCLIARYLVNSIAKQNDSISEVALECGIDVGDEYAYSLHLMKEKYLSKMNELELMNVFEKIEMPLIDVLYDMEILGFRVDKSELSKMEEKYRAEISTLENDIYDCAGKKFNISSPKQLSELLFDELGLNIRSNEKKRSTNIDVLNEIVDKHPIIEKIIRYRLITKLYNTYIIGFQDLLTNTDRIHTVFNQTLTATGRLSSSEPNLQNIPVRSDEGKILRKVFIPSETNGYIVSADYSQIELRLLAHMCGDARLISAFNNGEDIHARTASEIFGVPMDMVNDNMRRNAKAINFGIVYGISDFGLSQNIGISRKEAAEYISLYFNRYPKIEEYMHHNVEFARNNGYIRTLFGRIRPIPEITNSNKNLQHFGERVAMNMPLQGTASDIIKLAMIEVYNRFIQLGLKSKIILQVHDELLVDTHHDELDTVKQILKETMENVVNLDVKLTVNVEAGKTWYDAK